MALGTTTSPPGTHLWYCSESLIVLRRPSVTLPPWFGIMPASSQDGTIGQAMAAAAAPPSSHGMLTRKRSKLQEQGSNPPRKAAKATETCTIFGKTVKSDDINGEVVELARARAALAARRQALAKELRNAQRRRSRLKVRAKSLSSDDLVSILLMREQDMKKREDKNKKDAQNADGQEDGDVAEQDESPHGPPDEDAPDAEATGSG